MGFINQNCKVSAWDITELFRFQLICFDRYCNEHWLDDEEDDLAILDMMNNPLLRLAIPILREKLDAENDLLRYVVDVSIILSHHDFSSMHWVNMKTINRFLYNACEFDHNNSNILTDFIALIRAYNRYEDTYFYYEPETSVFSDIKLEDCEFKYLAPHDSTNIIKLCELDLLSGNAKELVLAYARYLNEKYGIKYQVIYETFIEKDINKLFVCDSQITYRSLASIILEYGNDLFFGFVVAYIKWKDLFEIVDDALFDYLSQVYIDGIKEFWWKCQKWGKHKDIINESVENRDINLRNLPLLDPLFDDYSMALRYRGRYRYDCLIRYGSEFIHKLDEFNSFGILMGIDIDMNINYLTNYKYENKIWYNETIGIEIGKRLYGETFFECLIDDEYYLIDNSKVTKVPKKKKADRITLIASVSSGRPKKILIECLSDSIPNEKYDYVLNKIKEKTNGKTKGNLLQVFRVAYEVGLFKKTPSRQSLIDYGYLEEDLGNDTTFSNNLTNEIKIKEAKDRNKSLWNKKLYTELQKLKEEVCS